MAGRGRWFLEAPAVPYLSISSGCPTRSGRPRGDQGPVVCGILPLIRDLPFATLAGYRRIDMAKAVFTALVLALPVAFSSGSALSGPYVLGDEPYRLNWGDSSASIESGCLKWNWQQYHWNDYCPVYVKPKAYMYPFARRVVLRSRG